MKFLSTQYFTRDLTPYTLRLIPIGIVLNLLIGSLVTFLKLPIFLDSIGTVLIATTCGPIPGMLTGVMGQFIAGITVNPVLPWYSGTAVAIGLFSGYWASKGFSRKWWMTAIGGLLTGLLAAIVSAPVTTYVFGGITLSGSSLIVAYLLTTGKNILQSVIYAGFASDPLDKMLTFLIVWFLIRRLPDRILKRFPNSDKLI